MRIPKHIYHVINNRGDLHTLFVNHLAEEESPQKAFKSMVREIKKYAPEYKIYKNYNSFKQNVCNYEPTRGQVRPSKTKEKDGCYEIPQEVIDACTGEFEEYMHQFVARWKVRKIAYDKAVKHLQGYFPNFKPYKNYQTYKSMQTYRK